MGEPVPGVVGPGVGVDPLGVPAAAPPAVLRPAPGNTGSNRLPRPPRWRRQPACLEYRHNTTTCHILYYTGVTTSR